MNRYACIDIGGTDIKYGLFEEGGCFLQKGKIKTEAEKGGPEIVNKVLGIVKEFQRNYEIHGVCISTAGMVDCENGSIFFASDAIPEYIGIQWKKIVEEKLKIPCEVENDVNCAGLAEVVSGAAKGAKNAVVMTVGTGIGGCLIMDGKVQHGASNSACEIGYMHLGTEDFQTLGAASVLSEKVAKKKGEPKEQWSGYRIFEEAERGERVCIEAIEELVDVLGKGIANLCYVVNPEVVVLGGGIMARKEYLKCRIESSLRKYLKPVILEHTKIEFASYGNDAGMIGAYYHFCERRNIRWAQYLSHY